MNSVLFGFGMKCISGGGGFGGGICPHTHTHTQVRRGRTLPKSSFVSPTPFPDRCLLERPSKSLDRRWRTISTTQSRARLPYNGGRPLWGRDPKRPGVIYPPPRLERSSKSLDRRQTISTSRSSVRLPTVVVDFFGVVTQKAGGNLPPPRLGNAPVSFRRLLIQWHHREIATDLIDFLLNWCWSPRSSLKLPTKPQVDETLNRILIMMDAAIPFGRLWSTFISTSVPTQQCQLKRLTVEWNEMNLNWSLSRRPFGLRDLFFKKKTA